MTHFEETTIRNVLETLEKRGYLAGSLTAELLWVHLWAPCSDEEYPGDDSAILREIQIQLAKGTA